jgi:hypothetical protein
MKIPFFVLYTNIVLGFALGNYRVLNKNNKNCKHEILESDFDDNYEFDQIEYSHTVYDNQEPSSPPQQESQSLPKQEPQTQQSQQVQKPDPQPVSQQGQYSKATFYFRVGPDVDGCPAVQTFNDGMSYGPCRSDDGSQGVKYTSESKYWAAIANASSRCGDYITVNYNGNSLQLRIMDECPGCSSDNHVDMSLDALIELTGSKEAACAINSVQPMITWY